MPVRLDRQDARRLAVRAQLLDARRATGLLDTVERLTFLQLDPTAAVAPSADLIAWSRMGSAYRPDLLTAALERDRMLFEHIAQDDPINPAVAMVRPMADLGLFLARMSGPAAAARTREWLAVNESFRREVLSRLRDTGPLQSRDIPDTSVVPWQSTGWTHSRNVTILLEALVARGQVAVSGRAGRQRVFDLAERVYPPDIPVVPQAEADRIRDVRRLRSLGIARPALVGDAGTVAVVDGSEQPWRVDPAALESLGAPFVGRAALLSPFDRLIHDRVRTRDLFGFEYVLEMYKPARARRWGYFALPVLLDDVLVGKLDATADRRDGILLVRALHADVPLTAPMRERIDGGIDALASWLGLVVRRP